tara:strand:+ start:6718 stop:7416 length:699 start_codon:yes stop_codon:yes gene_type:complete
MAEVEYGGIKIGGSKLLLILPLIGTLGGGLWAGFEFYKDYMDMKEQIEEYVAPDMSGLEEEMAVLKETIESSEAQLQSFIDIIEEKTTSSEEKVDLLQNELQARIEGFEKEIEIVIKFEENLADQAEDARTYTKSTAREIKDEMHIMDVKMNKMEKLAREAFASVRLSIETNDTKVRDMITVNSDRFDKRREQLRNDMDSLEARLMKSMETIQKEIDDKIQKALENPLSGMN